MKKLNVSIDYPDREENEPDLTEKQRSFIKHLLSEVGAENFPQETIAGLGKWQASSLIDRLIEIRDGVPSDRVKVKTKPSIMKKIGIGFVLFTVGLMLLGWLSMLFEN